MERRAASHHSSLAVLTPKLLPCQTATCPNRELLLARIQLKCEQAGEQRRAAGASQRAHLARLLRLVHLQVRGPRFRARRPAVATATAQA